MAKAKKAKTRSSAERSAAAKLSWANRKKVAKKAGKTATGQTKVATVHDRPAGPEEEPRYTAAEWANLHAARTDNKDGEQVRQPADCVASTTGTAKPTPYLIALLTQRAENNAVTYAHVVRIDTILQRLTGCNPMEAIKQPELDPKSGLLINLSKQNEYHQYLNEILSLLGGSFEGNI